MTNLGINRWGLLADCHRKGIMGLGKDHLKMAHQRERGKEMVMYREGRIKEGKGGSFITVIRMRRYPWAGQRVFVAKCHRCVHRYRTTATLEVCTLIRSGG